MRNRSKQTGHINDESKSSNSGSAVMICCKISDDEALEMEKFLWFH